MEFFDSLEPWQQAGVILGVIATAFGIAGRMWRWPMIRWVVGLVKRFLLWGFRRALIHILTSDQSEARAHVVYLLEPEITRLERVERNITTIERSVQSLSEIVHTDREVVRTDIARLKETMDSAFFDIRTQLHTLLGAVLGADALKGSRRSESTRSERR